MALWNKVLSGFNADDETVNFGARTVAETNETIFETSTLATIQSEGQVLANPSVSGSIQYDMLCVAVDNSITIFSDETCQVIVLSVGFDSPITAYRMSKDGSFAFIALATGVLWCLNLPTGGRSVFEENIGDKFGDRIVKIYLEEKDETADIFIVATSGSLYRIEKFDATSIRSALKDQDDDRLEENVKKIECVQVFKGSQSAWAASVGTHPADLLSIASLGRGIRLWPGDRCCNLSSLPYVYRKAEFCGKYGAIICLRDDGYLSIVCPETLLGTRIWSVRVADFVAVHDESDDSYHLVILTVAEKDAATTLLQFLSFPDFKCKFEISVPITTYLVNVVGCSLENIVFLEGTRNSSNKVETIRVKAIVESKPEYRLERLLRRERFDEAESFARKFQLSLDSVNAARAAAFVARLGPWSGKAGDDPERFNRFLATLDEIKDVKYIYDCCNNAVTSNYKQTRRLFLYTRERVTQSVQESSDGQALAPLLETINCNLRKLETFELIRKIKSDVQRDTETEDIEEWITFSRVNLLQECVKNLSLGELEVAAAIWIRHLPELAASIAPSTIDDILNSISETIGPDTLWPWLSHFVPSVISLLPSVLATIIIWGYKKTRSLEKHRRKEWPQIGLDFGRRLVDLLSVRNSQISFTLNQQYTCKDSYLHRLMALVQAMTDLLELKTRHRIVMSLEIYLDDPTNVVHVLLNKAHVEAIPSLIETFLQQYMLNNSLKNDQVFSSYVQTTLRNSKSWWFWEKAPWEQRVSIIIEHIQDVQNRLQQTVDVLKKAPVPWSDTIATLAKKSCNFDHPLVSKIRTECNGVTVKLILKKYGYAHVGLCTKLFRYIIKQDRKDMIDDIRELTRTDNSMKKQAFSFCTNHHLNIGNIDRAMEVLRLVDDDIVQYCCEQIVFAVIASLRFKERDERLGHYIEALGTVEAKLREILGRQGDSAVDLNDSLKNIPILKRIYTLDKHLNIWITHDKYYTEKQRVLDNYIERLVAATKDKEDSLLACCENLEKAAGLLDLSPLAAVLSFYNQTGSIDVLKRSVTRMARNGITSSDESRHVSQLCTAWITNADRESEISMLLAQLCVSNLVNCEGGKYSEAVRCYNQVTAYAQAIGYEATHESRGKHGIVNFNDQSYTLYTIYKDAAVSSGNALLPLFKDSLKILEFYGDTRTDTQNNRSIADDQTTDAEDSRDRRNETELLVRGLMTRAKTIQNEHHGYSLLHIAKNLHYGLSAAPPTENFTVITESRAVLSYCLYALLRKVVSARSLDVCLGLGCLFMLTEQEASKWLTAASRSFQGDLVRHGEVVNLGYEYFRITHLDAQLYVFERQKLLHRWGRRLTEYGISYKEMIASDMVQKRDILERVMHSKKSNLIPLLEDFCDDFGFNKDDCFLLCLQVFLKSWQPQLNLTIVNGRKELTIEESDVRDLQIGCKQVAAKIKDKAAVKRYLTLLSPEINFYHYEVFLTMLELIGEKNVERIEHFCFLRNYTRWGRPTEFEREAWANLCHDNSPIPPIAQWRLPFLPKIDQFKQITPELNLKTYEKWLSIAPTLKIQSHVICTLAIKGSVTEAWDSYVTDENRCQVWSLYPRDSGLLKDIKKCIKCMSGPDGLYYGTAALYFVVNHTPPGADQVAAAQECFALAQLWEQRSGESDDDGTRETMISKVKDKYLRLTSKHILHTHGVGDDKYTRLIGQPEKLIRELYNDESIPERWKGPVQHRPDVNSAAEALGRLFSINMTKIRYDFLHEWLRSESWTDRHDESMTMGFSDAMGNSEDNPTEEDNLLRACYILQSGDTLLHAQFLIDIGFESEKEDGYGAGMRFRALRVLQSIVDENTLQDLTKHDAASFRQYTKSLQYLNELERLGLAYNVVSFESCSKHKLAQILLKTQFYTPRALSLIVQICMDYGVQDHTLLDATLEQMVRQSMAKELEKCLPVIGATCPTITGNGYTSGWQLVIAKPFGKLDTRPSPKQIDDCIESLRLLHACPVVSKLEFKETIVRCVHSRQAHLAAALLPFLNDRDRDYALQEITRNFDLDKVLEDLTGLTPKGVLVVSQCVAMLRAVSATASNRDIM